MGKGARARKERQEHEQELFEIMQREDVRKAIRKAINEQLAEIHEKFYADEIATILYTMRQVFHFGSKRLKRYFDEYEVKWTDLRDRYCMEDREVSSLCMEKLLEDGIPVDKWIAEDKMKGETL